MSSTAQAQSNVITLKGSTQIVSEFFQYSINNILYQRGIYPPESFDTVDQYGLKMVLTKERDLKEYLEQVLEQLANWLERGQVQQIVLVVTGEEDKQTLERWVFNIDTDKEVLQNNE
jgi:mitotic spindle assembly checkpoint protein MAD2